MTYSFRFVVSLVVTVLMLTIGLRGQPIVGSFPAPPDFVPSPGLRTCVDLPHPANGDGEVSEATFIWSAAPCVSAVKVKLIKNNPRPRMQFSPEPGGFR